MVWESQSCKKLCVLRALPWGSVLICVFVSQQPDQNQPTFTAGPHTSTSVLIRTSPLLVGHLLDTLLLDTPTAWTHPPPCLWAHWALRLPSLPCPPLHIHIHLPLKAWSTCRHLHKHRGPKGKSPSNPSPAFSLPPLCSHCLDPCLLQGCKLFPPGFLSDALLHLHQYLHA